MVKIQSVASSYQKFILFGTVSLFYLYQFVLRVSPGVLVHEFMLAFQIHASEVGNLAALSLYAYALFQVPAGVFADCFGIRATVLTFFGLCLAGLKLFLLAPHLRMAQWGKIVIGIGAAPALLCLSKITIESFPKEKRSSLFGVTLTIGTLGALVGNSGLTYFINKWEWRSVLNHFFQVGLAIYLLNVLLTHTVSHSAKTRKILTLKTLLKHCLHHLKTPYFSQSLLPAFSLYLPISLLGDLWGVSFVMSSLSCSKEVATQVNAFIYLGLCIGSLTLSFLSDWIQLRRPIIQVAQVLVVLQMAFLSFFHFHSPLGISLLFFGVGFFAGAEILCFAEVSETTEQHYAGSLIGLMNSLVMLGSALFQELSGQSLDFFWSGKFDAQGMRLYSLSSYQITFGILAGVMFLGNYGPSLLGSGLKKAPSSPAT